MKIDKLKIRLKSVEYNKKNEELIERILEVANENGYLYNWFAVNDGIGVYRHSPANWLIVGSEMADRIEESFDSVNNPFTPFNPTLTVTETSTPSMSVVATPSVTRSVSPYYGTIITDGIS